MAEGGIPTENPQRGLQVHIEGADQFHPFATRRADAQTTAILNRTTLQNDSLLRHLTTTFELDSREQESSMRTRLEFSDTKLAKDGGYYSPEKRLAIQKCLSSSGFQREGASGDRVIYSIDIPGNPVNFLINYGPESGDAQNRAVEVVLPLDLEHEETAFTQKVKGYKKIYEAVAKAFYEVDGLPEPNETIVIESPTEDPNIEELV